MDRILDSLSEALVQKTQVVGLHCKDFISLDKCRCFVVSWNEHRNYKLLTSLHHHLYELLSLYMKGRNDCHSKNRSHRAVRPFHLLHHQMAWTVSAMIEPWLEC